VVPVFNGSVTIPDLVRRCHATLAECASLYELILVNDASTDGSWALIADLAASDPSIRGIDLGRNYGQHNALLAGIRAARFDITVTIDDDLQNPPEEIPTLLAALTNDQDVVYGGPIAKRQRLDRRLATQVIVRALRVLGGRTAPMVNAFRAFRTELRDGFADYTGPDVSIDGLLTWQTDRFTSVPVEHHARAHGESNYSLLKLIRHAMTMITAFSTRPLRMASGLGFLVIIFGIVVLAYVLVSFAVEGGSVPGFPFLASIISIFSGAQLFAIGVIGEYLARVHVRVMSRPSYTVRTTTGGAGALTVSLVAPRAGEDTDPPCRVLEWDSEFWGFPVARVTATRLDPGRASSVAAWCDRNEIHCAFLLAVADDADTAAAAQAVGFEPIDTRVTLERPSGPSQNSRAATTSIRAATDADRGPVGELSRSAHTDTRFFFDRGFPRDKAAELYQRWAWRAFQEPNRQLLVSESNGAVLGYLLLADDPPSIDLIAVVEAARGQGVGASLVGAAADLHIGHSLRVVTQARNVQAMRLYEANGFRVTATEVWYHRWK
jgi:glycosyltransferase involved in cell wall biosynthesis/ribosomal protein S18 acetylase RimI-like enzyme